MNENDDDVRLEIGVIEGSLQTKVELTLLPVDVDAIGENYINFVCALCIVQLQHCFISGGNDYVITDSQLELSTDDTTVFVHYPIVDDGVFERTECFMVHLSFPGVPVSRVRLDPSTAKVVILDDDGN